MRRVLTLVILAAVAGTAAAAVIDALLGSAPEQCRGQTQASVSPRETTSTTVADPEIQLLPSWRGVRVRRIRLDRTIGATWEEVGKLEPASHSLHARIDRPPSADVDVWLQSATGSSTIDLLGRESRPRCRRDEGREICVTNLDFYQPAPEGWRLIARKISPGAALIRLRLDVGPSPRRSKPEDSA